MRSSCVSAEERSCLEEVYTVRSENNSLSRRGIQLIVSYYLQLTMHNITLLPNVSTTIWNRMTARINKRSFEPFCVSTIALETFCDARYTHRTLTPIVKHQWITTTENIVLSSVDWKLFCLGPAVYLVIVFPFCQLACRGSVLVLGPSCCK